MSALKHVGYWGRLFGGSGAIINVEQDFRKELDPELIGENSALEFIPADRWELTLGSVNVFADSTPCPFNYYGFPLNGSRVMKFLWNDAPSFIRLRLQGWGMSEVEHCIRPINAYLKFENLLFELLDEAKVDVYKLKNFASTKISGRAFGQIQRTMEVVNQVKNYHNALVLDKEDDYSQKQLQFGGLAEIRQQGRMDLAAALRFPLNKLFGDSATGFGGGQDAMENYNAQVSTFRDEISPIVIGAAELRCQQLFGFIPDDLELVWAPLREMSGVEQEQVLSARSARTIAWFQAGLLDGKEASEQGRKQNVLEVDSKVLKGKAKAIPQAQMMNEMEQAKLDASIAGQSAAGEGPGYAGAASSQGAKPAGGGDRGNNRALLRHQRRLARRIRA
jgi:phage-related protein (TIGR01555 family)